MFTQSSDSRPGTLALLDHSLRLSQRVPGTVNPNHHSNSFPTIEALLTTFYHIGAWAPLGLHT